jgi:hypothetical protein
MDLSTIKNQNTITIELAPNPLCMDARFKENCPQRCFPIVAEMIKNGESTELDNLLIDKMKVSYLDGLKVYVEQKRFSWRKDVFLVSQSVFVSGETHIVVRQDYLLKEQGRPTTEWFTEYLDAGTKKTLVAYSKRPQESWP